MSLSYVPELLVLHETARIRLTANSLAIKLWALRTPFGWPALSTRFNGHLYHALTGKQKGRAASRKTRPLKMTANSFSLELEAQGELYLTLAEDGVASFVGRQEGRVKGQSRRRVGAADAVQAVGDVSDIRPIKEVEGLS